MSRLPQQTLLDLTCGLLESRSLAQFQEHTESLLARLFHADHVAFCLMHPDLPTGFEWKARTTGHFLQSYFQWYQDDFVFQWLSRHPNTAFSDTEMLRGRKLEDTETFRRSRESHLGLRRVLAVLLTPERQLLGSGAIALYSEGTKPFAAERRRMLQVLTPALSKGFQNFARFGALSAHNNLLEALLRQGGNAIVLDASRREFFRMGAITSLLEKWFPARSDRDEGGIPRAWKERMDAAMAGRVLHNDAPDSWQETRDRSVLEVSFTRLPRTEGRDLWELRLKEVDATPEKWRPILSKRQFEVAALVAQGLADKEVAQQLGIAEETAKEYLHEAYRKLGVRSRARLMALARRS